MVVEEEAKESSSSSSAASLILKLRDKAQAKRILSSKNCRSAASSRSRLSRFFSRFFNFVITSSLASASSPAARVLFDGDDIGDPPSSHPLTLTCLGSSNGSPWSRRASASRRLCRYMYVCMYVCLYVYIYIYIYIYILYVYMHNI